MQAGSPNSSAHALEALLGSAAYAPIADRAWIRVTGEDRVRWLNGMVTNSVQSLTPGQGNYNFVLNAQGQIQGDADIYAQPKELLLETGAAQVQTLSATLDRFIIMDDVELSPIPTDDRGVLVAGPNAASLLDQLGIAADLPELTLTERFWRGSSLTLIHAYSPVVPRFELWADPAVIAQIEQQLRAEAIPHAEPTSLEWLRTLEGTPRFSTDIRGRELPQETAQTRALHFSKGCYLGQEIVERIRSRGKVNRTFAGFRLHGTSPAPGTALFTDGKPVGELTTVSDIPPCAPFPQGARLALGYLRREVFEQHRELTYDGGTATPTSLPFPRTASAL